MADGSPYGGDEMSGTIKMKNKRVEGKGREHLWTWMRKEWWLMMKPNIWSWY